MWIYYSSHIVTGVSEFHKHVRILNILSFSIKEEAYMILLLCSVNKLDRLWEYKDGKDRLSLTL